MRFNTKEIDSANLHRIRTEGKIITLSTYRYYVALAMDDCISSIQMKVLGSCCLFKGAYSPMLAAAHQLKADLLTMLENPEAHPQIITGLVKKRDLTKAQPSRDPKAITADGLHSVAKLPDAIADYISSKLHEFEKKFKTKWDDPIFYVFRQLDSASRLRITDNINHYQNILKTKLCIELEGINTFLENSSTTFSPSMAAPEHDMLLLEARVRRAEIVADLKSSPMDAKSLITQAIMKEYYQSLPHAANGAAATPAAQMEVVAPSGTARP